MLVVHGSKDFPRRRDQGIGTFNALQRKGVPSKFLTSRTRITGS